MSNASQPYYDCIRRTLHAALCIDHYPSRMVEGHDKPEVEVADFFPPSSHKGALRAHDVTSASKNISDDLIDAADHQTKTSSTPSASPYQLRAVPELQLNPITICRTGKEKCLIESSANSVRVSFSFAAKDPVSTHIMRQYITFMQKRAEHFRVLRRVPLEGYDISFLITHDVIQTTRKEQLIDFVLQFVMDMDADVVALKVGINARAGAAAEQLLCSMVP